MQIFGIGPLEFVFILVIMLLVLGPKGMVRAARETGRFIRKMVHSPIWRDIVGTSREIRNLPQKIVREAGIEKEMEELRQSIDSESMPVVYHPYNYPEEKKRSTKKTSPEQISSEDDKGVRSRDQSTREMKPKPES